MSPTVTDATLQLSEAERDVLRDEALRFARALPDPNAAARYERLAEAAASGSVPDDLLGALETMLELLFTRGQPGNRAVLQAIFARTPHGNRQTMAARAVNRALRSLRGQPVSEVRLSSTGPAQHTLVIETDRCRLTLELDGAGARITSLETG